MLFDCTEPTSWANDVQFTNITVDPPENTYINQTNDPEAGQRNEDNTLDVVDDTYETYYLLKNVTINKGVTLVLDDSLSFNSNTYKLRIDNTGTSPSLTVIVA